MRIAARPMGGDTERQPYTALLYDALGACGAEIVEYASVDVVVRPPDVMHFHWPEHVLRRRGIAKLFRAVLVLTVVRVARWRGSALVWTAHNAAPHDLRLSRFDRWYLTRFDRQVDAVILLSEAGRAELLSSHPALATTPFVTTRHGHFGPVLTAPSSRDAARARFGIPAGRPVVAFIGQVRPYKGVLELVGAAGDLDVEVFVAGACRDPALRDALVSARPARARLHLHLEWMDAAAVADAIAAADLVVLPYRRVSNSGSAMLALSSGRRVLVPSVPSMRELQREVGAGWVRLFTEELTADDIVEALATRPAGHPDLTTHRWDAIARSHLAAYEAAVLHRGRRRYDPPPQERMER